MTAEQIAKNNLGYYSGYYSDDTRQRVERLFKCSHPIFGSIDQVGPVTPQQAFSIGKTMGEASKEKDNG